MSFAVDLVFTNLFFTASTFLHVVAPSRIQSDGASVEVPPDNELQHLLVLVPLYNEVPQAVEKTFESISKQAFPSDKLHVRCIVEKDDDSTREIVEQHSNVLSGVDFRIVTNTEGGMKAGAMNHALEEEAVESEYVVIYDGDDEFEENQLAKLVGAAEENGYDAVMPRVYRTGNGFLSKALTLDTHIWNAKVLPFLHQYFGVFPQSGEGSFFRRSVIEDVGGFPHSLTEDAMMSIAIAENGGSFGLVESRVYERAPTSVRGHFTQRLRWNRGYFSCLKRVLGADLSWKERLGFVLPFIAPITSLFTLPVWIFFIGFWFVSAFGGIEFVAPWMTTSWYLPFLYWSAGLAFLGNLLIVFSYMQTIAGTDFEQYAPYALFLPLYWMFLSVSAMGSVFKGTKEWGRTDRRR